MGYRHEVAFAVGGQREKVEQLLHNIKAVNYPDLLQLMQDFEIIEYKSNLTLLAYYHDCTGWYDQEETLWNNLKKRADEARLSYVFRRIGENIDDAEMDSNHYEDYFDSRMEELIVTVRCIKLDPIIHQALRDASSSSPDCLMQGGV